MINSRKLPIESAYNFRDLGGYQSQNGKHVKWRTFLRSGDFAHLSAKDALYLESFPIKSVVDFRSTSEVERQKDALIKGAEYYLLPVDSGNLVPQFMELMNDNITPIEVRYARGVELMITMYKDIINHLHLIYRRFFDLLQHSQVPVLFHCTAGKDRTGIASALILTALGVDKTTIISDYLLTNDCLTGKYDNLRQYGRFVEFFETVRVEYLEAAFSEIDKNFGGMDSYLKNQLAVDVDLLRTMYLE
ncbi:MAG: tyrosine-protein phosphatase [Paludibacteraceae bacterium]|nr:tyrosine-protein phosphatase [Paludibacteraceae bacterium]